MKIGLRLPRDLRAVRIEERVDAMIRGGLVAEVAALLAGGLDPAARSLRAIGYREAVAHLEGRLSLDELRERMVVATRRFAKRQDTWFRKEEGVRWFAAAESPSELPALLERVMMTLPRGFEPRPNVATAGVERQTPDQEARP